MCGFEPAITDYRYLREIGYSPKAALKLVGDRHELSASERNLLFRGVSPVAAARARAARLVAPQDVAGRPLGVDWYNVRNSSGGSFRDDTVGSVPLGIGFRGHIGDFTADLRGVYDVLFDQGFARGVGNTDLADIGDETPAGRFGAQLRLGATF